MMEGDNFISKITEPDLLTEVKEVVIPLKKERRLSKILMRRIPNNSSGQDNSPEELKTEQ